MAEDSPILGSYGNIRSIYNRKAKMTSDQYLKTIEKKRIRQFGFDTHARVLDISVDEAMNLWNEATNYEFKRVPMTEYTMRYLPELSTKFRPMWKLLLNPGTHYLSLIHISEPTRPY